jgi:hypothetical protein
MSYAPIYSKLNDIEERLKIMESVPKTADIGNPVYPFGLTPDTADSAAGILDELNKFKINFVHLLNECNPLSTRVAQLSSTVATLATKEEVATFATKAELPDVSAFATKAELPDVSAFATKAELPDVSAFATKAELPDVSAFATKAELPDVSGFATKAELPDVSTFATKAELPDVSGFATKAELPDVSGFVSKTELTDLYTKFDNVLNVIAQLHIKITEANEKIAALESA